MSVLIKGIEMPTGNDELRLIIRSNGQVIISHKTYYEEAEAVPFPPHGDLIDTGAVNLDDGPYEYQDWVEWAWEQYLNVPVFLPADPPKEEKND